MRSIYVIPFINPFRTEVMFQIKVICPKNGAAVLKDLVGKNTQQFCLVRQL